MIVRSVLSLQTTISARYVMRCVKRNQIKSRVNSYLCSNRSLGILFGIVQQETQQVILVAENPNPDTSVVRVEAKDIILRTV